MTPMPLPETPKIDPAKGTYLLAGAASPLWLMFGGAAMAGASWWWWSARWREATNLEALMAPSAEPVIDPVTQAPTLTLSPITVTEPIPDPEPVIEAAAQAAQDSLDTAETAIAKTTDTVKAAAKPAVAAAVEATKTVADDLTLLVGIGPKLAASLSGLGVTRFSEIAAWDADDLARFDKSLNLKGRAERDAWVAQAKRLSTV